MICGRQFLADWETGKRTNVKFFRVATVHDMGGYEVIHRGGVFVPRVPHYAIEGGCLFSVSPQRNGNPAGPEWQIINNRNQTRTTT
jgi:hypothetical protein